MSTGEIRVGDIGTKFLITVRDEDDAIVDISSASTIQVIFKKPSGDKLTKTATLETDGTDGQMYYTSVSGDLDECGQWKKQGFVDFDTSSFKTDISSFRVHRNL